MKSFRQHDGGFKSRKFVAFVFTVAAVLLAGKWVAVAAVSAVVSGLVTLAAIYIGGNTATRYVMTRDGAPLSAAAQAESKTEPQKKS